MKKNTIVLASVLMLCMTGFARKISFGIKGGALSSHLTYAAKDEGETFKYEGGNAGFHIGGVANIQLSDHFAIQPNLLFAMKGGSIESYKITTSHIEVPVHALYTNNGFFIGAGPNFSYAFSGKLKIPDADDVDIFDADEAENYTLKPFEIGASVLMGYTFPNGLFFSANFSPGLNNIYEGNGDNEENIKAHTKAFGFSIGYMFGKKGK